MVLLQEHDREMGVLEYFEGSRHVRTRWARAMATGEGHTKSREELGG